MSAPATTTTTTAAAPIATFSIGSQQLWWGGATAAFFALVALTASLPLPLPSNQKTETFSTDSGSTAWMLVCAILGFLFGPALAYFYSSYHDLDVTKAVKMATITASTITMMWILFTYSLVWGDDAHGDGILGYPKSFYMFHNVGAAPNKNAPAVPSAIFAMFELAFAVATPTLVGIYMLNKINLKGWMLFVLLWHLTVWAPVAHVTWTDGWFSDNHIEDFSGGIVVHICAAAAMAAGKLWYTRHANTSSSTHTHNSAHSSDNSLWSLVFVFFLWFAINAGKAHAANSVAAQSIANTFAGSMASIFTSALISNICHDNLDTFSFTEIINAILIALVSLTPASGYVTIGGAMVIAVVSNLLTKLYLKMTCGHCCGASANRPICMFTLHGVTGTLGFLLTAVLSYKYINTAGFNGLTFGVGETLAYHIAASLVLWPCIFLSTYVVLHISDALSPLTIEQGKHAAVPSEEPKTENSA